MSYIGNPIVSTDFPVDYASGNGSTTAFTLSVAPASVNAIDVQISGVSQSPQTYTVSGTTLTFSAAPPTGTNNIVVRHLGIAGVPNVPAVGSVTPALLSTANAVYWDGSGNVGIGTTSPSTYGLFSAYQTGSGLSSTTATVYDFVGAPTVGKNAFLVKSRMDGSQLNYVARFQSNDGSTEGLAITTAGNVGIGTTSPVRQLSIYNASAAWTSYQNSTTGTSSADGLLVGIDQNTAYVYSYESFPMVFGTNSTERMRIDSSGYVQMGCTSTGYTSSILTLSLDNSTKWVVGPGAGIATRFYVSAVNTGGVYLNGTAATTWTAISDERFKTNLTPILDGLNKVNSLRAVTGTLKNDESQASKSFLIAQDVLKVLPEAVDTTDPECYGLAYTDVIPLLVAAIKELNAKVDAQALEIQALKGTV